MLSRVSSALAQISCSILENFSPHTNPARMFPRAPLWLSCGLGKTRSIQFILSVCVQLKSSKRSVILRPETDRQTDRQYALPSAACDLAIASSIYPSILVTDGWVALLNISSFAACGDAMHRRSVPVYSCLVAAGSAYKTIHAACLRPSYGPQETCHSLA